MIFASAPPSQISQISKFSRAYTNPVLKKSSDINNNQYNFRNNPQTKIRAKDSLDSNNKVITQNNFCTVYQDENKPNKVPPKTSKMVSNSKLTVPAPTVRKQSYIYAVQNNPAKMANIVNTRNKNMNKVQDSHHFSKPFEMVPRSIKTDSPYPVSQTGNSHFTASTDMIEIPDSNNSNSPKPAVCGNEFGINTENVVDKDEMKQKSDLKINLEISEACTRLINLETKSVIETSSEEEERDDHHNSIKDDKIPLIRSCSQPEIQLGRSVSDDLLRHKKLKSNTLKKTSNFEKLEFLGCSRKFISFELTK